MIPTRIHGTPHQEAQNGAGRLEVAPPPSTGKETWTYAGGGGGKDDETAGGGGVVDASDYKG